MLVFFTKNHKTQYCFKNGCKSKKENGNLESDSCFCLDIHILFFFSFIIIHLLLSSYGLFVT